MRPQRAPFLIALLILFTLPCRVFAEEDQRIVFQLLPEDDLFPPLLADPQTPIPSLKYFSTTGQESLMGKISAGAAFGLMRLQDGHSAIQMNIEGGIFSRFDLYPLVVAETADYRLGFSLSLARPSSTSGWAFQISPYHTSAHLLDDTLFKDSTTGQATIPPDYSRDVVRLLAAYRFSPLNRVYAGMAYAHDGINVRSLLNYQAGSEFFTPALLLLGRECRLYLADDLQAKEETDWNLNLNLQAGLSVKRMEDRHGLRIAVEYFAGNAVEGQFSKQKEQNIGLSVIFDL